MSAGQRPSGARPGGGLVDLDAPGMCGALSAAGLGVGAALRPPRAGRPPVDPRVRRAWHRRRLSWMPYLWHRLKAEDLAWAEAWQARVQQRLCQWERVRFGPGCFVAPEARIFAEPGREVVFGAGCLIGAGVMVHGPAQFGDRVSLNPFAHIEGGAGGVVVGDDTRIAAQVRIFAWDHGMDPGLPIREQSVRSRGVRIGTDVWLGAGVGVTDGVCIGDHAVVGMGAVVTRDLPAWSVAVGAPARVVGDRRRGRVGPAAQP